MFKRVEYVGFDGHDDLRRLAEGAQTVLAGEISDDWHSQVEVTWAVRPGPSAGVELTVSVATPVGSGTGSRYIPITEFANADRLASRCGWAWDSALGDVLDKRRKAWDEIISEPVEA